MHVSLERENNGVLSGQAWHTELPFKTKGVATGHWEVFEFFTISNLFE
jgi:hypothetical protein